MKKIICLILSLLTFCFIACPPAPEPEPEPEPERPTVTITFNLNGGHIDGKTENIVVKGSPGEPLKSPVDPHREYYVFKGWNKTVPSNFPEENIFFIAQWLLPYLCFTSTGQQSLDIRKYGDVTIPESLQYSVDEGITWSQPSLNTPISFGNETKLYLRGKSKLGMAGDHSNYLYFSFGTDLPVECHGDIRNLVDWTDPANGNTKDARFCHLFKDCTSLTQAPDLPATTLAKYCYYNMFKGCTSLTQAPQLPATTLSGSCYSSMFSGCTNLTQAPELPATTLVQGCYWSMFKDCTSLTQAPKLPATTLVSNCYYSMFKGCTSLTQAPELPATILADYCYDSMFSGCTSLTQAPQLPATTLSAGCYWYMFIRCTKLKSVTMLATDISVYSSLSDWLTNTADNGILTVASGMENNNRIKSSLPSGWTIEVYQPPTQ